MDIQEQLAHLRQTVARIQGATPPARLPIFDNSGDIDTLLDGGIVRTPFGSHFETERLYPSDHLHGSSDIGSLTELRPDLLAALSDGAIADVPPERWLFLDTETTGL